MSSFHNSFHQSNPRFESPAKVFAKLKSKVQREALFAKEAVFTNNGPPTAAVRDKRGADFNSPKKRSGDFWVTEELKENHRFGPYRREVQASTLSPISSPQKTFEWSFPDTVSKHADKMSYMVETVHPFISRNGHTPAKRVLPEPTAASHPLSAVNTETLHIRDVDGFKVTSGTPVILQNACVRAVLAEECAPLDKRKSSVSIYSPMRNRLRKRKSSQELTTASRSTRQFIGGLINQPLGRRSSPDLSDDDTHNTEDVGDVRGLPADQSDRIQFTRQHMFTPQKYNAVKRETSKYIS